MNYVQSGLEGTVLLEKAFYERVQSRFPNRGVEMQEERQARTKTLLLLLGSSMNGESRECSPRIMEG